MRSSFRLKYSFHVVKVLSPPCSLSHSLWGLNMYATLGNIGSIVTQGVVTVSGPFHPFGGAVDIIVVQQEDGSFKCTPWYVKFGKFQGVLNALKRQEKTVVVSVNDVDANLRMYLDHKGEAYFLKEDVEVGAGVSSPSSFPSSADEELGPLAIEYPRTDVAEETPTPASLSVTDHDSEMGASSKKDAPSENGVGEGIGPIEDGIGRSSSDDEDDDNFGLQEEGRLMGALEDKLQVEATDTKHAMAQFREGIDQVEESVKSFYSSNVLELDNNTTDVVRGLLSQAMHLESTQSPRPTGSLIAKNAWESVSRVVASSTSVASDESLVVATDSTSNNPVNEGVSIHVNTSSILEPSAIHQIDAFYPMLSRGEGYSDGFALKQVEIRKDMVEVDHKEDSSASMVSESINATSKHTEAETKRWVPMREQQSDYASEETISTENGSYIYAMNSMPETRIDIEAACESNSDDQKGQDSTVIYDGNVKLIEDSESFSKKQKLDLEKEAAWKTVVKKAVIALEKAPFRDMSSNSVNNSTDFSSSDRVQKRSWIWWRWQANGSPRPKRVLDRSSTNNHVNDGKTISQNGDKSLDRQISSSEKSTDGHENVVELLDKRWSSGKRATNFKNLADTQPASLGVQQENNSRFSYDKLPEALTTCAVDNMGTGSENKSDEIFDTSNIDEDVFKSCVALPELLFGEDEEDQLFGSNEQQLETTDESAQTARGSIKVDVSEDNPDFSKSRASPIDIPDGKHIQAVSKEYMSQSMPNATNREEQCENFGYVSKLFSNSTGSHFISTQYEERFDAGPSSSNEFGPSLNGVGSLVKDTTEAIADSLKADQSISSSMNTLDDAKNNSETGLSCEASDLSEHTKVDNVDMHSTRANSSFSPDNDMQICTGLELSLCRHLLREGMGAEEAAKVFESAKMSLEQFKMLGTSIIANDKLVARVGGKYYASDAAMHIILGMLAFGQVIVPQKGDVIRVEHEASVDIIVKPTAGIPGGWRLWPFVLRRPKVPQQADLPTDVSQQALLIATEAALKQYRRNGYSRRIRKYRTRTNIPTSDQLASLNLKEGNNKITFTFVTRVFGKQQVDARIYLWKWNTRIVISDVDGTITRSDVLGQFMPLVGKDWSQTGVTRLFSAIKENGYELMFLSARAIAQAYITRQFLLNLKQDGEALPDGPVVISPDGLFPSLYREVIRRAPHEFKIACLQDIRALFPADCNPFYAGFGNRDTDEISYLKVGIPKGKIFIINPKGEIIVNSLDMKSYTSLHKLVDEMFPPYISTEQEVFNSWNFWRVPIPDIEDELTKKSSSTGKKGADLAKKGADSKK